VNLRGETQLEEPILNLTPMIDVVFNLLVFFMCATSFLSAVEREIEVELPSAESGGALEAPPEELVITVRADGAVFVGGDPLSREELLARLRTAAQGDPETPVTIRGDRQAEHQSIVSVMDACGLAGLFNLAVGTTTLEEG
jgi:biopolymer transport protein ExbD